MIHKQTATSSLITRKYSITQADLMNKGTGKPRIQAVGKIMDDLTATVSFLAGGISMAYFGTQENQP